MKNSVNKRIRAFIDYLNISDSQFSKTIGVTQSVIASMFQRGTEPSYKVLSAIINAYANISAEWLLRGEGSMLRERTDEAGIEGEVIPLMNEKTPSKKLPVSEFNLYDIDISAGLARLFGEDGDRNKAFLGRISIPNMPKCDGAVKVIGDSMYPLLKSGDIIAYREIHNIEAIQWGEIYILQIEYDSDISVVVKYVKKSDLGSDHVLLVSYNKEHDPKDIDVKNITAIARVILCIRQLSIL